MVSKENMLSHQDITINYIKLAQLEKGKIILQLTLHDTAAALRQNLPMTYITRQYF